MRQGQQNRRGRGRGRKPQNPLSRSYESNGPDVKIRGTAAHVAEKYMSLARDALASGDMITAESYLQHAEHYNRIIMAAQAQSAAPQAGDQPQGQPPSQSQPQPQNQPQPNGGPARTSRENAEPEAAASEVQEAERGASDKPPAPRGGRPRRNGAQTGHEGNGAEPVEAGPADEGETAPTVAS